MSKKRKSKRQPPSGGGQVIEREAVALNDPDTAVQLVGSSPGETLAGRTSRFTNLFFSVVVLIHFVSLLIAFSANMFQSRLQQQVMWALSPYLVTTSQAYGAVPLELTHAESIDLPLVIEVQVDGQWGTAFEQFPARWSSFSRILRIIVEDDPESSLIGDLIFQLAQVALQDTQANRRVTKVRLIQPYVPNFDEASMFADSQLKFDELGEPEIVFVGSVIYQDERPVGILPILEDFRNADPVSRSRSSDQTLAVRPMQQQAT